MLCNTVAESDEEYSVNHQRSSPGTYGTRWGSLSIIGIIAGHRVGSLSPREAWKRQVYWDMGDSTEKEKRSGMLPDSRNRIRGWKPGEMVPPPVYQYVAPRFCPILSPFHLPIHHASGWCLKSNPSRRSPLKLCQLSFTTDVV